MLTGSFTCWLPSPTVRSSALVDVVVVGLRKSTKGHRSFISTHSHIYEEVSHVSRSVHILNAYCGTMIALDHGMDTFFVTTGSLNALQHFSFDDNSWNKLWTCYTSQS
jgi:hypothetical protein